MIISVNGHVKIEGIGIEVMADATCILHSLYQTLSDKYGKEIANEKLVKIGRLAVMSEDDIEKDIANLL